MVKEEILKIEEILKRSFQDRGLTISKIVLFGSYLRGKIKKDSDIDIIVISPDFKNRDIFEKIELTKGIHKELVKRTMKPIDILYYSDVEWEKADSLIINTAKQNGRVIYG
jgi:predicted nucleotidyltransferase